MKYSTSFINPITAAAGGFAITVGAIFLSVGMSYFLHGIGFRRVG